MSMMFDGYSSNDSYNKKPNNWPWGTDFVSQEERDKFRKLMEKDAMFSLLLRFLINFPGFVCISGIVLVWSFGWFYPFINYAWSHIVSEGEDGFGWLMLFIVATIVIFIIHIILLRTGDGEIVERNPKIKKFLHEYLPYDFHYNDRWEYEGSRGTYYQLLLKLYDAGF